MKENTLPQPVAYPALRINGVDYQFRRTHTSDMLMLSWGFTEGRPVPLVAWAAAMAGFADDKGNFRSAGFFKPHEFTDILDPNDELQPIYDAVNEALKKAPQRKTKGLPASSAATGQSEGQQPAT